MKVKSGKLKIQLTRLGACEEAIEWVGDRSLTEAWAECERGDRMLWLVGRMIGKDGWPTHQQVVLTACACAELALVHVPAGEDRPQQAIETARRWARGEATLGEVRSAAAAAYAAASYAASYAAAAAAYAAASYAASYAAAAAYAADAAAYDAASAAAYDATAYDATAAAKTETLKRCADICREMLHVPAYLEGSKDE